MTNTVNFFIFWGIIATIFWLAGRPESWRIGYGIYCGIAIVCGIAFFLYLIIGIQPRVVG